MDILITAGIIVAGFAIIIFLVLPFMKKKEMIPKDFSMESVAQEQNFFGGMEDMNIGLGKKKEPEKTSSDNSVAPRPKQQEKERVPEVDPFVDPKFKHDFGLTDL